MRLVLSTRMIEPSAVTWLALTLYGVLYWLPVLHDAVARAKATASADHARWVDMSDSFLKVRCGIATQSCLDSSTCG